jgi:hypothetical protein
MMGDKARAFGAGLVCWALAIVPTTLGAQPEAGRQVGTSVLIAGGVADSETGQPLEGAEAFRASRGSAR